MIEVKGKFGIEAKILCDSVSEQGVRLTTFELSYPRIVHSEFLTHRMFSRNAASSRAIPAAKMREQLTARPVRFGANISGMQDTGEDFDSLIEDVREAFDSENGLCTPALWPEEAWEKAREDASYWSTRFAEAGYHKQVFNRLTEAFQMIKVVCTATEFGNFFWLRDDGAADPTIHELARCMREGYEQSTPAMLKAGEWHLPYLHRVRDAKGVMLYGDMVGEDFTHYTLEQAIKVSSARCAAVSFRNVEYGVEKSEQVHARLIGDERKHASAMEHQATPMQKASINPGGVYDVIVNLPQFPDTWEEGVSHLSRDRSLWSGNFKGWIQYRKTVAGENME